MRNIEYILRRTGMLKNYVSFSNKIFMPDFFRLSNRLIESCIIGMILTSKKSIIPTSFWGMKRLQTSPFNPYERRMKNCSFGSKKGRPNWWPHAALTSEGNSCEKWCRAVGRGSKWGSVLWKVDFWSKNQFLIGKMSIVFLGLFIPPFTYF